jgi:CubicO group peptidase (beta-lactamase class C family)
MYRRTMIAFLLMILALPAVADDRSAATDAIFARWGQDGSPGCAVAVMQDGETVYEAGFGRANLEHEASITPSTVFHIASVSKQFVAFAVCLLATDGKLTLDDDIREYVPEVPDLGHTITLRHLIHHASGLRDQWDLLTLAGWRMEDVITRDDAMELIAAQRELNFEPGAESLYSNTGYTLLGMVVERVSGRSLDAFCQQRIFEPLGMTRTHFHEDHRRLVPGRAECYGRQGDDYEKIVLSYAIAGATSLFTTVEDLARWEENFYTGTVGGSETLALMESKFTLTNGTEIPYGLGIPHGMRGRHPTRSHAGGDAGFRSFLLRFPEKHMSIAILANTPMPTAQLAHRVATIWLGEQPEPATADAAKPAPEQPKPRVTLDHARLEHLAGHYQSEQPPIAVELTAGDGVLDAMIGDQVSLQFVPESETRFRLQGAVSGSAEFAETDGVVTSMSVEIPGSGSVVLERIEKDGGTAAFDEFAGVYESPELSVRYEIILDDAGLQLKRRKHGTVPLVELGPDHFGGPFRLGFERDANGDVSGFRLTTGRIRGLQFRRLTGGLDDDDR